MIEKEFPYIKYDLPNGVTVLLTPRPDAYHWANVEAFISTWNPKVRFQFTDDLVNWKSVNMYVDLPYHWYPWVPGRKIPPELVWAAVNLIHVETSGHGVVWMHCDSSSMRAPTFFGHFLNSKYNKDMVESIVATGKWTDGRHHSSPIEYAETSMKLDPGVRELIETWKAKGPAQAYGAVLSKTFNFDLDDEKEELAGWLQMQAKPRNFNEEAIRRFKRVAEILVKGK